LQSAPATGHALMAAGVFGDLPAAARAATGPVTRFPFRRRFLTPVPGKTVIICRAHEEVP